LPAIINEANESGGKLVQQKLAAYSEELEHKLTAFEAELNKAKAPEKPNDTKAKSDDDKATTDDIKANTGDTKTTDAPPK